MMPTLTPTDPALRATPIALAAGTPPQLFVVVDTEEDFDWTAGFFRTSRTVASARQLDRVQRIFDRFGVAPTYVVDFPIASQRNGYGPIAEFADSGRCAIGAHLHPWVNPPFTEPVCARNSYGCNLDPRVELEKLRILCDEIGTNLGVAPRIYKAGRYGFGSTTADTLERLGFDVDMSINPGMDYSSDGGPSFEAFDANPFAFGTWRRMVEIPCTTGYAGLARRHGAALHRFASGVGRHAHLVGVLSRLGIVDKITLSPEQATTAEMMALTRSLVACGTRTFTLAFHSPSVEPGNTPYVRTRRGLDAFLARIDAYLDFFFGALGGVPSTPLAFKAAIDRAPAVSPVTPRAARAGEGAPVNVGEQYS